MSHVMLYNSNIVSIANKVSQAANILELYKVYICFKFTLFIFYFFLVAPYGNFFCSKVQNTNMRFPHSLYWSKGRSFFTFLDIYFTVEPFQGQNINFQCVNNSSPEYWLWFRCFQPWRLGSNIQSVLWLLLYNPVLSVSNYSKRLVLSNPQINNLMKASWKINTVHDVVCILDVQQQQFCYVFVHL